jgi:WD40 repeat protein
LGPRTSGFLPARFSPDGDLFAFISDEGVELWTDHEVGVLKFNLRWVSEQTPLVFSPDGGTIATGSRDGALLWDANAEQFPDAPRQTLPSEEGIASLVYSPDGSLLVSSETRGIIEIWDAESGELRMRFDACDYVCDVQFSLDGRLLRASQFAGDISMWDMQSGDRWLTLPSNVVPNVD